MASVSFTDPVLQALSERVERELGKIVVASPLLPHQYFQDLAESIIGQQLSTKVATTIIGRVQKVIGADFTPAEVLKVEIEALRQAGLSYAKAQYLHNLALAWEEGLVTPDKYPEMSDEEIITDLIKVKGIGRWTAEMFLIFTLARSDVFSIGDFALKKAVMRAYNLPPTTKAREIVEMAEKWHPHRSLASRILWKSLELSIKD